MMNETKVIGLTGGIGCGKTTVTDLLQNKGISVVDADIIARGITPKGSSALKQIVEHFGPELLSEDNSLNRAALRQIIFQDRSEKQWLEALLHPLIRRQIDENLIQAKQQSAYVIFSSPLLFETDQSNLTDFNVVIRISEEKQIQRAMLRDNNTRAQIKRIIDNQTSASIREERADAILDNNQSKQHLTFQVEQLHQKLLALK